MHPLRQILKDRFGFDDFRLSQEEVCAAVAEGKDVLLVMPTGAGKSLCYQLPGIAREGVTLVISPLLALIDDQVTKLRALGFRAEQIHSGRTREDSRAACIRYLCDELDFLFIAPERLAVPGFPEMLEKRKPSLIAIDEAHCISQWGHDFRPEYRKLGDRLARLRPSPVIALTATATPLVQDDIIQQLGIPQALRFIQGFRRTNLSIQVYEVPVPSRGRACITLLQGAQRIPAIIYAPTRKAAEEISEDLKSIFKTDCYHAGLTPDAREKAQTRFLSGKSDVIVATVAFGMGIDKADVRTVIHAGLSGSVEAYYQEIGRAGRDGDPSQAFLLHSFADQRTHNFFFERDYPEIEMLEKIFKASKTSPRPKEDIRDSAGRMDTDIFDKALEKLWFHGGVLVDPEENVTVASPSWIKTYSAQRKHREASLQQIVAFTQSRKCRMQYFLDHFGDRSDRAGGCGSCDRCSGESSARRALTSKEKNAVVHTLAELTCGVSISIGRLFEGVSGISRAEYEHLLEAMAAAKWIEIEQDSFEKDGRKINYRKIVATYQGENVKAKDVEGLTIQNSIFGDDIPRSPSKKKTRKSVPTPSAAPVEIVDRLRAWRLSKAKELGLPAFRIFGDRVLHALASEKPRSIDGLLQVHGFGPKLSEKFGKEILSCLNP